MTTNNTTTKLFMAAFAALLMIAPAAANTAPVIDEINIDSNDDGEVTLSIEADAPTDVSDLASVEYEIKDSYGETVASGQYSCDDPYTCSDVSRTISLSDGDYTAEARVFDNSFRSSNWIEKDFEVDTSSGGYYGPTYEVTDVGVYNPTLSKGEQAQLQADIRNRGNYDAELEVRWFAVKNDNEIKVAERTQRVSAGSEETLAKEKSWYELSRNLEKETRYDVRAKVYLNGDLKDEGSGGYLYLNEEEKEEELRIENAEAENLGDGEIRFRLEYNKAVNDVYCAVSDNDAISTLDTFQLERVSNSAFEATRTYQEGSYTRYLGCVRGSYSEITEPAKVSFSVESENQAPEIDLIQPENREEDVSRNPRFEWRIDDDQNRMEEVTLKIDRNRGDWNDPDFDIRMVSERANRDVSYDLVTTLREDTTYYWRVEADDGEETASSRVFRFTTREEDDSGPEDGSLSVTVRDGEGDRLENARVTVENGDSETERTASDGEAFFGSLEPDDYDVDVRCDGELETRDIDIDEGESETLTVRMDQDSSDNYCGDDDSEDVSASISVSDSTPEIGEDVEFDGSGSEGDIKEYRWRFPDGTTEFGRTVIRDFDSAGEKDVELRVTDYDNSQDTDEVTIDVQPEDTEEDGELTVTVRDDEDDRLEDARVTVENGDSESERTDDDGEAFFGSLEPDDYEVEVRCEGEVENRDVEIDEGESESITVRMDFDSSDNDCDGADDLEADLDIDPSSAEIGEEIEFDAGDSESDTDIEEYEFDLDGDGDWDVETDEDRIERRFFDEFDGFARVRVTDEDGNRDIDSSRYEVVAREPFVLSDVDSPRQVCNGESFDVSLDVRNPSDDERFVVLESRGFGDSMRTTLELEEDETRRATIEFTAGSPGSRTISIETRAGGRVTRTVEVLDCSEPVSEVSGLSVDVVPQKVSAGESVKVSGYVEDARGREEVEILVGGRRVTETLTQPDGYYQVYVYPEEVGGTTVVARSGDLTARTPLRVEPTVGVSSLDIDQNVFQGENFDVCARVESQVDPLVILFRNGEKIDSTTGNGEVCFTTSSTTAGETEYRVGAYARNAGDSISREVDILETKPETTSFPEKIASVESGDGIVKTTIYNTQGEMKRYSVSIEGLPGTWTSTTEKEVVLEPGEEREVFFYLTPQREGRYQAQINIDSQGSRIYEEEVPVITGGTNKPPKRSLLGRLGDAFQWW